MHPGLERLGHAHPSDLVISSGEPSNTVLRAPERLREQAEAAQAFAEAQHAPATRRAYAADLGTFEGWCHLHGLKALPALPATVATFLAFEAQQGAKVSTITRRSTAIRYAHGGRGLREPDQRRGG